MFSDIVFKNDFEELIKVPLHYSAKDAFVEIIQNDENWLQDLDMDTGLPKMGFELIGLSFDSQRMLNPLSKIKDVNDSKDMFMFNRIPYNFQFHLYIGTRKFEDSLKIVEQIIPFFTPEFNVTIKDKPDFDLTTDVPFVLNDVDFQINWNHDFTERTSILWTLAITAKAWLYSNVREKVRIKETIVNLKDIDFERIYTTLTSEVFPREALIEDEHIIISGVEYLGERIFRGYAHMGQTMEFTLYGEELSKYSYLLPLHGIQVGQQATAELIISEGPIKLIYAKNYSGETARINSLQLVTSSDIPIKTIIRTGTTLEASVMAFPCLSPDAYSGQTLSKVMLKIFKEIV